MAYTARWAPHTSGATLRSTTLILPDLRVARASGSPPEQSTPLVRGPPGGRRASPALCESGHTGETMLLTFVAISVGTPIITLCAIGLLVMAAECLSK